MAKIAHLAKMDITGLEMMLPVDAKVSLFDFKFPKMFNTWYFFIFQTAGFSVTKMEPVAVSVKRKMDIADVKTDSTVTNVIKVKDD